MSQTPRTKKRDPKLCRHKGSGQAFVTLNGRRIYLGRWGSDEAEQKYHRVLAEWKANGRQDLPKDDPEGITVVELINAFRKHAEAYYRRVDGTPTGEAGNCMLALRPVRELYGRTPVAEIDVVRLETIRQGMIERGHSRSYINSSMKRIRRVFRWGVSKKLVPASVLTEMETLDPLRRGRSAARETEHVKPVPKKNIASIKPHVSRQVWTLIQLQLLTGARPGELVALRPCDVDTSGKVWIFKPEQHKTAHYGHKREIYLGPKAQKILKPFLLRPADSFCFCPREAEEERLKKRSAERKTPISHGNCPGTNRSKNPKRTPGDGYTTRAYARAIRRACKEAEIPSWSPGRLRHSAGTELRRRFGLEMTQTILGHRIGSVVTEIYAEADREQARKIMSKIG